MTLSEAIREEIDRRAITQAEAAEAVGVQQQTISRWASGEMLPQPEHLPELARFLRRSAKDVRELRAASRRDRDLPERLASIEDRLRQMERAVTRLAARLEDQ